MQTAPPALRLRNEWYLSAGIAGGLWAGAWIAVTYLYRIFPLGYLFTSGSILFYAVAHLRRNLSANQALSSPFTLYPNLGAANWITLSRAFLLALLAGFVFLPPAAGWAAWIPGGLYMLAVILDFCDGAVARLSKRASRLGEILDMEWDGVGVLTAAVLLVLAQRVPPVYLLVGLARYLFVLGLAVRKRRGLAVFPLPPSLLRRALAGIQMGFIAVALLPVFSPPVTRVAALIFAVPLLAGFLRDWLHVSGALSPAQTARLSAALPGWGNSLARVLLAGLLGWLAWEAGASGSAVYALIWLFASLGILAGAAGRLLALGVLLAAGLALPQAAADWRLWLTLPLATGVLIWGTGRFSIWKPEEWLITHRIGDTESPR